MLNPRAPSSRALQFSNEIPFSSSPPSSKGLSLWRLSWQGLGAGIHICFPKFLNLFLLGTSGSRKKSPAPSSRRGSLRRPSLFDEGGDEPTGISLLNRRDPSPRAPSPSNTKLRRGRPSLGGRTLTTVSCNFELLQVSYFLEILRIHLGILKIDHS